MDRRKSPYGSAESMASAVAPPNAALLAVTMDFVASGSKKSRLDARIPRITASSTEGSGSGAAVEAEDEPVAEKKELSAVSSSQ